MRFFTESSVGKAIVGFVVFGIILVFVLEFRAGSGSSSASLSTECAVKYAGTCVDSKDYYASLGLISPRGLQPKESRGLALRKRVLDGLAERELLIEEAERLGLAVSDAELEEELTAGRAHVSLPAEQAEILSYQLGLCRMQEAGYGCEPGTTLGVRKLRVSRTEGEPFDYKLYEREVRIVANRGAREFRTAQERELVAERLRQLVRQRARVPEAEAFSVFERGRTRAVVRSAVLERSWFAKFAVDTSDAAVDRWAATNALQIDEAWKTDKERFTADCPLVSELAVALPPNALDAEKAPARERIEELRARIEKGASFEAVAKEASSAPSAIFGGKVGCLHAGSGLGADTLLAAANKLAPGALSEVLETPRGFHVLRLDGKLAAADVEREGRRQVARNLYAKAAADDAMNAFANDLVQKVKAGAKLEDVVKAKTDELARASTPTTGEKDSASLPALVATDRPRFEVSAPFGLSGNPLPDVTPLESLAARAFELPAPDAVDEKPVPTATGLVVLQLKEKTPASKEEFEKEKWTLLRALQQAKASEALSRYVAELRRKAGDKLKVDARFGEEAKSTE